MQQNQSGLLKCYEQVFDLTKNHRLRQIADDLSSTAKQSFYKLCPIMLKNMSMNRYQNNFAHQIEQTLKPIIYNKVEDHGPICSKIISTEYYNCNDCQISGEQKIKSCFCEACFKIQKHRGHNFRLIKTSSTVCDCGDQELLKSNSFCSNHGPCTQQLAIRSEDKERFIKQMQFFLFTYVLLNKITSNFADDSKKKEIYGCQILKLINNFVSNSYSNQTIATHLFTSNLPQSYISLKDGLQSISILNLIIKNSSNALVMQQMRQIILLMSAVKEMKTFIITEIFNATNNQFQTLANQSPLNGVCFQYLMSGKIIERLLKSGEISPLTLNCQFQSFRLKTLSFIMLFQNYLIIFGCINHLRIVQLILSNLDITELCKWNCQDQKSSRDHLFVLQVFYFRFIIKVMKILDQSSKKQFLLKKIVRQCYKIIKTARNTVCLSVERTFALACFVYLKGNIESIFDMHDIDIMELLQEDDEEEFVYVINGIIRRSINQIKLENYIQYKQLMTDEMKLPTSSKFICSVDHIYLKIMLNIMYKLEQPTYDTPFQPLHGFMKSRQHSIQVLFDLYNQQISKIEETIDIVFFEICLAVNSFVYLAETTIYEMIVKDYFGYEDNDSILEFYKFLVYVFDPKTTKQFKKIAENYLNNQKYIQTFLKLHYKPFREQLKSGKIPTNKFNLSYCSYYFNLSGFKQTHVMYELKLRSYRRTQLSRYIFNQQNIRQIVSILRNMFDAFPRQFKKNNKASTKLILLSSFQTLIVLFLETKDQSVEELIEYILTEKRLDDILTDYCRQTIQIYKTNKAKLQLDRLNRNRNHQDFQVMQPKRQQFRKKMLLKKRQMQEKQSQFLKTNSLELSPDKPIQSEINQKKCLICKEQSATENLNYLSNLRFTNLVKQKPYCEEHLNKVNNKKLEYPVLLISTCGHLIHLSCLIKSKPSEQNQIQFQCFLCNKMCNLLVPIKTAGKEITCEQAEHFMLNVDSLCSFHVQQNFTLTKLERELKQIEKMGMFKIIHSIADIIYGYSLRQPKYFIMRILPILSPMLVLLNTKINSGTCQHIQQIFNYSTSRENKEQEKIVQLIKQNLKKIILYNYQNPQIIEINQNEMKKQFAKLPFYQGNANLNIIESILLVLWSNKQINPLELIQKYKVEEKNLSFYDLPKDLRQLNLEIGKCKFCSKITSKILICFLCGFKVCQGCTNIINIHVGSHLDTCIFIKTEIGECIYYHNKQFLESSPLYLDYAGDYMTKETNYPQKNQFTLSEDKKNVLIEAVLEGTIQITVQTHAMMHDHRCLIQ